jgi:UDP-N-acetylglucosamine 2-epimerase (non-hydrolysing)
MKRIVNIVGTRPNLVKMSTLLAAQRRRSDVFESSLIHTGQHQDPAMSESLLAELELPRPDITLRNSHNSKATQMGKMIAELGQVLGELKPDLVVVVGDVNTTAAGALAAAMLGIPVAHVEAGLRSFDRGMPEELNRVIVDAVSDLMFASEPSAVENLVREGRPATAVHHVGNVMIDALVRFRPQAANRNPAAALGVDGPYGVLTLHRPSNVDGHSTLTKILQCVGEASRRLPIVFPIHPRTRDRLEFFGLRVAMGEFPGLCVTPPLGYLDMMALIERAQFVLTDSGGLQEETTFLGIPCLTLRENTERPVTVSEGTNRVIGTRPERIVAEVQRLIDGDTPPKRCPALWDGQTAARVVDILAEQQKGNGDAKGAASR